MIKIDSYFITLDKENASFDSWESNFYDIQNMVEVVWSGKCDEGEAKKHFSDIINKQKNELNALKTITKWRIVRLYDSSGKQLKQES